MTRSEELQKGVIIITALVLTALGLIFGVVSSLLPLPLVILVMVYCIFQATSFLGELYAACRVDTTATTNLQGLLNGVACFDYTNAECFVVGDSQPEPSDPPYKDVMGQGQGW